MYPNLYYVLNDWFGWKIDAFKIFYTFGIFVALAFVAGAWVLTSELKRKEKEGLLNYREETVIEGAPASITQLIINALVGFIFGYKVLGAFLASRQGGVNMQEYVFSSQGSIIGGLILGGILLYAKYREKEKHKLPKPEKKRVKVWPHDRVGDMIILALVFGIVGAKIFDNLENWDRFIEDPIRNLFAPSGLTFYGGLICAGAAILYFAKKKGIGFRYLLDAFGPAMMIAYAVGRIGCQMAGDGDWGIYNSAYISNEPGTVTLATGDDFQQKLKENETYFLKGTVIDPDGKTQFVTDRIADKLEDVPHKSFKGLSFLPTWMFAFTYPHNVNEDGVLILGCEGQYCRALPLPVFPTPFYEIVACTILFLILWVIRKKIKIPGVLFSIYLIFNGMERFLVETIRVNTKYDIFGIHPTQAELISLLLVVAGILSILYSRKRYRKELA